MKLDTYFDSLHKKVWGVTKRVGRALGVAALLGCSVFLAGCWGFSSVRYEPVLISFDDLRKPVILEAARPIDENGKIILYKNFLLVNEPNLGIHVFDNTSPEAPAPIGFLAIPGNTDVVVKDDLLYAKSYIDLVVLDVSDFDDIKEKYRIKEAFRPPYDSNIFDVAAEDGVIIELKIVDRRTS